MVIVRDAFVQTGSIVSDVLIHRSKFGLGPQHETYEGPLPFPFTALRYAPFALEKTDNRTPLPLLLPLPVHQPSLPVHRLAVHLR